MEENKNIEPEQPAENILKEIISSPENTVPETGITELQTKEMEVHHHNHSAHGKKTWKAYFWEFLMLFLAVFCGFIAENMREHFVENERAKELAKNLYKEILADSINVQQRIAVRKIKETECAYFISYVRDSNLTLLSDRFFPAFSWALIQTQRILFEPNDGILNQLRNSGELRYFKNPDLQAALGKLSVMIANIRNRHERESTFIENNVRPFTLRFYDFNWYEALVRHGDFELYDALNQGLQVPVKGKISNLDKFDRLEAENTANYYLLMLRATRKAQYGGYAVVNHQLLEILRKEYHLE